MSEVKVPDAPWMHPSEINLITSYLRDTDTMLEWGCGGSTVLFSKYVQEYHSIEHNREWYEQVTQAVKDKGLTNVTTHYVGTEDGGGDWPSNYSRYKSYIEYPSTLDKTYDRILVDGRGRQFCVEYCIPFLKPDGLVFFHDFWMQGRERYRDVALKFFDEVASIVVSSQTLAVLKVKPEYANKPKPAKKTTEPSEPMKISIIQPTRNNLKYLKWAYNAIRKNQGNHVVEICVADDASTDGTWDWCTDMVSKDPNFKAIRNEGPNRLGHTILYDRLINEVASHDVCMIYHADMYLCPGALDHIQEHIGPKKIVSLTRIEPPLHPDGPEKVLADWGIEPEEFNEEAFLNWFQAKTDFKGNTTTEGIFAPWAFMKADFQEIGGHDPLYAPQSKEDSDIFNRFQLNGVKFIQTWKGCVYHMTCRGSRFNPTLTTPGTNSNEWEAQNIKSTRNFIRKWGHFVKHDQYLKPIVPPKYNLAFVVKNCNLQLLEALEPWCDRIYVDEVFSIGRAHDYIEMEQSNTKFDLQKRVLYIGNNDPEGENDIVVTFDATQLNQTSFQYIQQLSEIIKDSGEIGEFKLDIFTVTINNMKEYQKDLIVCNSTY